MYYIVIENSKEFNKAKGENISIELEEYKNILFNSKNIRHKMKVIHGKQHNKSQKIHLKWWNSTFSIFSLKFERFLQKRKMFFLLLNVKKIAILLAF